MHYLQLYCTIGNKLMNKYELYQIVTLQINTAAAAKARQN